MDITVKKDQLLETLKTNREEHARIYQIAIEKYRSQAITWFNKQVDRVKAGKAPERSLPLPLPEEHTDDYDRVIAMMEWEIYDELTLSEQQFEQYVRNQWGWARTFASNSTSYLAQ